MKLLKVFKSGKQFFLIMAKHVAEEISIYILLGQILSYCQDVYPCITKLSYDLPNCKPGNFVKLCLLFANIADKEFKV